MDHQSLSGSALSILACKTLFATFLFGTFLFVHPPFLDVFLFKAETWSMHTCVNEWRRAVFGFLVSLTKVKKTVKFGETTSILEAVYLSHKRLERKSGPKAFQVCKPCS